MIFSGCASTDGPMFSDNPVPPPSAGATATAVTNDVQFSSAPRFEIGESVNVATSTGSDMDTGPLPNAGQNILIADDGTISLPLIGKVVAAGKTPGELQDAIQKLYVPQYFTHLAVIVTAPQRVYYVGGEVMHPGAEVYVGETTVSKAVQEAGDLTQFASHTVWLNRADGTRIKVNLYKALRDSTQDPPVYPGDQIQVPRRYF
jgi:polysaccharide biosynthesis/export protein